VVRLSLYRYTLDLPVAKVVTTRGTSSYVSCAGLAPPGLLPLGRCGSSFLDWNSAGRASSILSQVYSGAVRDTGNLLPFDLLR
jgi:hypothetical protein